jgi:hypothetical protein
MSQQFGNPLMRFLRKVKARFTEREGTRGYQRRLERETRRVARTFAGELQPVLIHTYGKVGSTAIQTSINKLSGFGSFPDPLHLRSGRGRGPCRPSGSRPRSHSLEGW